MDIHNVVSFGGLFVLIGAAWLLSADRRRMNFRAIAWGVALQLALGALVFRTPHSRDVFRWLNDVVLQVLTAAQAGRDHGWNSWMARPSHLPEHLHPTHWTASEGIKFLQQRDPTKPFFMLLSFEH